MTLTHKAVPGVTMIEVLVVTVIIGILAIAALTNIMGTLPKARDSDRKSDLKKISTALEQYYNDRGGYPLKMSGSGNNVSACGINTTLEPYLKEVPCDPSKTPYLYDPSAIPFTGTRGDTVVRSYRLLTKLENASDPIIKETCPKVSPTVNNCGGSYKESVAPGAPLIPVNGTTNIYNYGLASGTAVLE